MWLVLLFIVLSAAFRSLQEIAKWRPGRSWIPRWFFDYRGPINLDPYHFVSALHWLCMFIAGTHWVKQDIPGIIGSHILINIGIVWLIHGLFNDLFYHFIWMKRDYWFT